jgi:hypothetical protein
MKNRFKAMQGAIQAVAADYQNYIRADLRRPSDAQGHVLPSAPGVRVKSYRTGDFAIVQALLVVASEIAALTDTLEEYNRNDQLLELEKIDERRHKV